MERQPRLQGMLHFWYYTATNKVPIIRFITEITKSEKMHKFRKSLNISLVKSSTVSFNCIKSYSQSTVSQKNCQGSHFLPFHLFDFLTFTFLQKSFLLPFNQCLSVSSDIGGRSCYLKASRCQIMLYVRHFARFPILNLQCFVMRSVLQN